MEDNRATQTVSAAGAKNPAIKQAKKSSAIDISFSIANLSNRYKIGDVIGSGGNSTVVEAYDRDLKRTVAIKLLKAKYHKNKRAVGRFLNEARITALLQHPGIVPVYEVGYIGNKDFFFSMKKVEGHTLRDSLNEDFSHKKYDTLFDTFYAICETMAYAHDKGITHRDLKPENIMIEKYGSILMMDWGLSKNMHDGFDESFKPGEEIENRFDTSDNIELTMTGEISGTPSYMSPEQALGMMNKLNQRSDVFSLGILLYEIVTGQNPFSEGKEGNFRKIFDAIKHENPPELSKDFRGKTIRKELVAICKKCLEKLPDDRYMSANELYLDLKRFKENRPVSAYRTGAGVEIHKWVERQRKLLVVITTIIALISLAFFYKKTSEAEIAGVISAIDQKISIVHSKDQSIDKTRKRFTGKPEETYQRIIASHEEHRRAEWSTAKSLILYLSSSQKNNIPARHLQFIKTNWFLEIKYYISKSFLYEADRSLTDFIKFNQMRNIILDTQEKKTIQSYFRILGKKQGDNHVRNY